MNIPQTFYRTAIIQGLQITYREAGDPQRPQARSVARLAAASSHQYRNLIPALASLSRDRAGLSGIRQQRHARSRDLSIQLRPNSTTIEEFLNAKGFDHYGLFVQDYGGPVGFRIIVPQSARRSTG